MYGTYCTWQNDVAFICIHDAHDHSWSFMTCHDMYCESEIVVTVPPSASAPQPRPPASPEHHKMLQRWHPCSTRQTAASNSNWKILWVSLQFLFHISGDWSKPIPSSLNVSLRQEFLEAWVLLEVEIADITGRQDLLELSSAFLMSCVSRIFSASFAFSASSRKTQGLKSLS